jgi:hypothetical protein
MTDSREQTAVNESAGPAEHPVWQGSPSQVLNFWNFLRGGLGLVLCLAGAFWLRGAWKASSALEFSLKPVAFWALVGLGVFCLGYMLVRWLILRSVRYSVSSERIRFMTGIFSKVTNNLELYRVEDTRMVQPFFMRLFGCGNVFLFSSDKTTPELVLRAVPKPMWLLDELRPHIERCRDRKRVRVVDFVDDVAGSGHN